MSITAMSVIHHIHTTNPHLKLHLTVNALWQNQLEKHLNAYNKFVDSYCCCYGYTCRKKQLHTSDRRMLWKLTLSWQLCTGFLSLDEEFCEVILRSNFSSALRSWLVLCSESRLSRLRLSFGDLAQSKHKCNDGMYISILLD